MTQRLLEGEVTADADPRDDVIDGLQAEVDRLERELARSQVETQRAKENATRAMGMLRRQLGPLYRALQAVFGELDAAGVAEADPSPAASVAAPAAFAYDARIITLWTEWKSRVSPSAARVIDALLTHGELSVDQLCVAAKMGRNTVYDVIKQLKKPGLLVKNGGRLSLKRL